MSFCRLLPYFVIVCIGVGLIVSKHLGVSLTLGASLGLLAGFVPLVLLCVAYGALMFWRPDLPVCRCGQTKYGEYEHIPSTEGYSKDTWHENRCPKCERRYKSKGTVVMECRADGTLIPYMKVSRWGRWQPDDAPPDGTVAAERPGD